jgi:type 1 fimbria pilin
MFKKMGVVTVGVAAGLMVAAPFASATECHDDSEHHSSHERSDDNDCNVTGGSATANGGIDGDSALGNVLAQAPVGGANLGNVVCNRILNDNLSGNNIAISVL